MKIQRSALLGGALGILLGLAYTGITLFQFDRTQFSTGDLLIAGFAIAVPLGAIGGFLAGWAWALFFERRER